MNRYITNLPAFWLGRLYLASSVLIFSLVGIFDVSSQAYRAIVAVDDQGHLYLMGLVFLSSCGIVDVVINDLLPSRFFIVFTERNRHLIYMGISMGLVSTAYVIAVRFGPVSLHARLSLDTVMGVTLAFLDLFYRRKK